MISTRIVLIALCSGCAHSVAIPPLAAVENETPIRWPLRPLTPLQTNVQLAPLELELATDFIRIRSDGLEIRYLGEPAPAGTSLDRGYARRFAWISDRIERYLEVFRGSPIASLFQRVHRGPVPDHSFEIPPHLDAMISFEGHAPIVGPRRTVVLDPSRTEKPIVIFRSHDDTEGVLFFFPHQPELRRWHLEDYVITATVSAYVEARDDVAVRFPELTLPTGPRMSFDFPIFVMPYRGSSTEALAQVDLGEIDYWNPRPGDEVPLHLRQGGLRMLRYFPTEFASWIDSSPYTYGHEHGFAWGDMTSTMKGIVTDPLHPRALLRDQSFRALTFFVEAGAEKGAPPNLMMHPQWTEQMEDPNDIRTIVFCQYWEFRLYEFERLFDSPHLTEAEKAAIYDGLQAARRVFDPSAEAFAKETPNGGLWFDYLDLPITEELGWIVNTHTTNLENIGVFAQLARKMGREEDHRYWRRLFVAGLDGQSYALAQDWMWKREDPNELRYSRISEGPQSYHFFMLLVWVPHIARLSLDLAPDRTGELLELMRRLMKAKFVAADRNTLQRAKATLAELEAARAALTGG